MKYLSIATLGVALCSSACGSSPADTNATADPVAAVAAAPPRTQPAPVRRTPAAAREVTIPAGTELALTLTSALASDANAVEDAVTAELTRPITIAGRDVIPAGAALAGVVTDVDGAGRIKGRATIGFHFTSLRTAGRRYDLQTAPVSRRGPASKAKDGAKIAVGAGAGAVLGGLFGGKKGAAEGAAIGGGAGTGLVLATKGQEVRLARGADVTTRLTAPLTVRVVAPGE